MSEWASIPLEDLVDDITVGFVGSMTKEYVESGIPFLRSKNVEPYRINFDDIRYIDSNFHQKIKKSALTPGDIVIVRTGKPGSAAIIPESLPIANCSDLVVVRPSSKLDKHFLVYYLNSIAVRYINSQLVGAVQQHFNIGAARELKIHCPEIEEQKEIAAVLSCLDRKIENLRKQNETLEQIAQTLFKHWFVDFEFPYDPSASSGQRFAQGRPSADGKPFDIAQGKPYKSSGGEMVPSELGDIPAGWRVGKLGDEFNITMGQSPAGSSYNQEGKGLIFFQGRTDFGFRFPQVRLFTTEPKRIADKFDVLVSVRAPVGDINVSFERCCIGRGLSAVSSKHRSYCLYKLKSHRKSFDVFETEGTVFGSLNKQNFNGIESVIPCEELIEIFESTISPADKKIFVNERQIQALTQTRDTLLPKLMSGKLRIQEGKT